MPRNLFFLPPPHDPRWSIFEFDGSVDADLISRFAQAHPSIRVEVRATFCMPNGLYETRLVPAEETRLADEASRYEMARFNMSTTMASPAEPGMFPGIDHPERYTRVIFNQDVHPICVSFRNGDGGPDLALLFFNKREGKIEGRIQEGIKPALIQVQALIDGLRHAVLEAKL